MNEEFNKEQDLSNGKFTDANEFVGYKTKNGDLEVVEFVGRKGTPLRPFYKVRCKYGIEYITRKRVILKFDEAPCNHCKGLDCPDRRNDIIGKHINRLTCIAFDHMEELHKSNGRKQNLAYYRFKCDCGNETIVERNLFLQGKIKSCGCANYIGVVKHGDSRTKLYHTLQNMNNRCYNPNFTRYEEYGGRGITVCHE